MSLISFIENSFLIAGGFFGVIWGLQILITKKYYSLSLVLFISSLWLFAGAYSFSGIYLQYPNLFLLHLPFVYCVGPLLYFFYKKNLMDEEWKTFYFHFIPAILVFLAILPFHFYDTDQKYLFLIGIKEQKNTIYSLLILFLNFGTKVHPLIYLTRIILENKTFFKEQSSNLLYFIIICSSIYLDLCIGILGFLFKSFFLIKLSAWLLPINLCIFFLLASKYPDMLEMVKTEFKKSKYRNSKIQTLNLESVLSNLEQLMNQEKAFSDEDISLTSLANELSITPHQLSEILNEKLNKNFAQYINEFRIAEAKKLLLEESKRSILSIGYAVG
ncbi:MAG TPA: helix-turn-helix domain-containing protein, partial [Leptospiraceae bacterium]|nr:helix-turn-helix domain-containing protein [Leptospiraceae bacterium]